MNNAPILRARFTSTLLLAGAAANPPAASAEPISFDNSCGNGRWSHVCSNGLNPPNCLSSNNWNTGSTACNQSPPAVPGATSDVSLGGFVVTNNGANPIRSLIAGAMFINAAPLRISTTAVYGGQVVCNSGAFEGGTHTFMQGLLVPSHQNCDLREGYHRFNGELIVEPDAALFVGGDVTSSVSTTWFGDQLFSIDSAYAPNIPGGIFRNPPGATFIARGDGQMRGVIGLGHFINGGDFVKEGGVGLTSVESRLVNTGTIEGRTGTLRLSGPSVLGGVVAVDAGAAVEIAGSPSFNALQTMGPGDVRVSGTVTMTGDAVIERARWRATHEGEGSLTFTGSVDLAGTFNGTGDITIGAACHAVIAEDLTVYNSQVRNAGHINWLGGNIALPQFPSFANNPTGVIEARADGALTRSGVFFPDFNNQGRFGKYAGDGTTTVDASFYNEGVVEAAAGTLVFDYFNQTFGVMRLAGGAVALRFPEQPIIIDGGILTGTGTVKAHLRCNAGRVAPGTGSTSGPGAPQPGTPGVITVAHDFRDSSYAQGFNTMLDIDVGGLVPGLGHDQLVVNGNATIAGSLRVARTNNFTGGGSIDILLVSPGHTVTGQFEQLYLPPGVTVTYLSDRVRVNLTSICAADLGVAGGGPGQDGRLDNNDFIAFINHFFNRDPRADMGVAGGLPGRDGQFDNNDFIAFINRFFAGC